MSKRPTTTDPSVTEDGDGDAFLTRWARRKRVARDGRDPDASTTGAPGEETAHAPPAAEASATATDDRAVEPGDEDMPPLESIDGDTDMSGFFSPRVSQAVKKAALRKFFHSPAFNVVDGLDDYDDDFRNFAALGDIVTSDMRTQMEREAEKAREQARKALDKDTDTAPADGQPVEVAEAADEPVEEDAAEEAAAGGHRTRQAASPGRRRVSATSADMLSAAELEQRLGCRLPDASADGRARNAALVADTWGGRTPTSLVSYDSAGSIAIIADGETGEALAARLGDTLACTLLIPRNDESDADGAEPAPTVRIIRAALAGVSGYLGNFSVRGRVDGEEIAIAPSLLTAHKPFDIVLDLGGPPQLSHEILPPGYYAPGDEEALERALAEIPGLVGEFEKPRYFRYDADICAHGASGIHGCNRCLDTCPTVAIASIGDTIEVNPYLCQGAGACATACPSGAITYAFPLAGDLLRSLRRILAAYREAGGTNPQLLLHDGEAGREWLAAHAGTLPENVIPCETEEIGATGMDVWLGALAFGAGGLTLLCLPGTPPSVRHELESQAAYAGAVLEGMGYPGDSIRLDDGVDGASALASIVTSKTGSGIEPAAFEPQNEKRTNIRLAVDHLCGQSASAEVTALPSGAPFGEVVVDEGTCTLCMACVSVCPASALADGGSEPRLNFIEWNCVQCGLCEHACPEDAIRRRARFVYDPVGVRATRVLNEDKPFHCVGCGKPFATTRVIESMREKLAGHWMFQKPEAVRRLEMCEDCRVKDMFKDGGGLLE